VAKDRKFVKIENFHIIENLINGQKFSQNEYLINGRNRLTKPRKFVKNQKYPHNRKFSHNQKFNKRSKIST